MTNAQNERSADKKKSRPLLPRAEARSLGLSRGCDPLGSLRAIENAST